MVRPGVAPLLNKVDVIYLFRLRQLIGKRCCNVVLQQLSNLPLEMLETVLMRAFLMLYASDFERDDDRPAFTFGKSRSAERQAFFYYFTFFMYYVICFYCILSVLCLAVLVTILSFCF